MSQCDLVMAEARGKTPACVKDHYHPIERAALTRREEDLRQAQGAADQAEAAFRAAAIDYESPTCLPPD